MTACQFLHLVGFGGRERSARYQTFGHEKHLLPLLPAYSSPLLRNIALGGNTIYYVIFEGQQIGYTELSARDSDMGIAWGTFVPSTAYTEVRGVFELFSKATEQNKPDELLLRHYYAERDKLHLVLTRSDGSIIPTDWIHIVCFDNEYTIEVKMLTSAL